MNQLILKLRRLLLCDKLYYLLFIISVLYFLIVTIFLSHKSVYNLESKNFECIILNYKIDGNKLSLSLKCMENLVANYYFKTEKELNSFKNGIDFGDKLKINGTLKEAESPSLPNTFNYKKYLYNNKIYYILDIEDYKLHSKNKNILFAIKNLIYNKINKIENNEYIYAFVLGQSYFIDGEINDIYRYIGVTHLFALSGTNVALIYMLISFILKKLKRSEIFIHILVSLILFLIIFITGFSPSIIRASIFFILLGINKIFNFYIKSINVLLLTFFVIIFYNPYIVYNIGFQLSFVITFFLILYNSLLNSKNKLKNLFFVGLISFAASAPIVAYNFYYLNFFSLINNLIFVPLVSYIIFPLSLITFIFPFFSSLLKYLILLMEFLSSFLYNIKIFCIVIPKINLVFMIIYYISFIIFNKSQKMKYLIIIFICLFYSKILNLIDNNYYIYFLDVGQGDSILVRTPFNKEIVMIDTGGKLYYNSEKWKERKTEYSYVKSQLIPFLNSINVNKINYLFLTHGDVDHMGYSNQIIKNIKVKKIYINKGNLNYLERTLKNKKASENQYNFSRMKISSINNYIYTNENDNSLILVLKIYDYKILLMGDASKKVEYDILDNYNLENVDILKVGHHGSNTSTSEKLLKEVKARYAIISVGKRNKYNHPSKDVIKLLIRHKIKILNTIDDKTIIFKINKNQLVIKKGKMVMKRSMKKGFTLIELLAVIAILAVLVIVAVPNVINMYRGARSKAFLTQAKNIYRASEQKFMSDQLDSATAGSKRYCHSTTGTGDNLLVLSGNKNVFYDITIDTDGDVTAFKVIDASYSITITGTAIGIEQVDTVDATALATTSITCS